ncbi:MAG: hypothetical protein KIT27_06360 [Legionellales bacterium]|nr:hypothetical protein [Legionellales bacterium]
MKLNAKLNILILFFILFLGLIVHMIVKTNSVKIRVLNQTSKIRIHKLPMVISKNQNLTFEIPTTHITERLALDLSFDGALNINLGDEYYILNFQNRYCKQIANKELECHIPITQNKLPTQFTLKSLDDQTIIYKIKPRQLSFGEQLNISHNKLTIIFLFIIAAFVTNIFLHKKTRLSQWFIIVISVIILIYIQPVFTFFLVLFLILMYYFGKNWLSSIQREKKRRGLFFIGFTLALLFLVLFKYGNKLLFSIFSPGNLSLALPLGVSYFVIRLIDTLLRWYRQELSQLSLREFLCFILFFPTIPAGPIETVESFLANRTPKITADDIAYGFTRISFGMVKKIIIADMFLSYWLNNGSESLFFRVGLFPHDCNLSTIVFSLYCSFFYAYFDFSGYSDMAIGFGRLFGYKIMENFNWPILATNLQEFWRRWHRSLSMWCFRNIYFPLVLVTKNPYLPFYATMIAVGLWHVYDLSWFSWAIYHASGLCFLVWFMKRVGIKNKSKNKHKHKLSFFYGIKYISGVFLTISYVALGHVFVMFSDYATAMEIFLRFWQLIFTKMLHIF